MIIYTPPQVARFIPVIDFSAAFSPNVDARKQVAWAIHKACRETGFFYLANHGVPANLIERQFEFTRRFFELPVEQKLALHMKNSYSRSGYEPLGGQILDHNVQNGSPEAAPPDLKESFYVVSDLPDDHPFVQKRMKSFGNNQWPLGLPGFREQMLAYKAAVCRLADRVLAVIALSLELDEDYFAPFHDIPGTTLRLLHYPPHPPNALHNQLGAGAHTDWGGITLLVQDDRGGLEVRNVEGDWIAANPIPDTFVVNLGDLMERWTNGLYRSNMHRVRNNSSECDRYSIPLFYSPRPDSRIECLPTCAAPDNPPRYPACTASEHLFEMFKRSYPADTTVSAGG